MEHLINNNLLSMFQHGFIKARSCTTQLLAVLDDWTDVIEHGENVDAIYLDYAKAFDTVPHKRLLAKLSGYGIGGKLLKWIAAFLEGRRQRVIVNGSKSVWRENLDWSLDKLSAQLRIYHDFDEGISITFGIYIIHKLVCITCRYQFG